MFIALNIQGCACLSRVDWSVSFRDNFAFVGAAITFFEHICRIWFVMDERENELLEESIN
jgi:hypothetical protein